MNERDKQLFTPDPSLFPSKRAQRIHHECNRYRKLAMQLKSFEDKVRLLEVVNEIERELLEVEAR